MSVDVRPTSCSRTPSSRRSAGSSPATTYPFTLTVKNYGATPRPNAVVTLTAPDCDHAHRPGRRASGRDRQRQHPDLERRHGRRRRRHAPARATKSLVVEAQADSLGQDPQIVWKDLSTDRRRSPTPVPARRSRRASHGPKVIPPGGGYETARYGDRPFPVVPVDYFDRAHDAGHSARERSTARSTTPAIEGSTFNLYQEMSYGQLFPHGTVPSDGVASRRLGLRPGLQLHAERAQPEHLPRDHQREPPGRPLPDALRRADRATAGTSCPATTDYYGDDSNGSALIGARGRRRRAAGHRLAPAGRPARRSTTPPRSPIRRSTTPTTTPTRTASSTSS